MGSAPQPPSLPVREAFSRRSLLLPRDLDDVFERLGRENFLRGLDPPTFGLRAAHFYGELDAVHPFREGNSRTLRQFFSDLAVQAGYKIDWSAASSTELRRRELILARDIAVLRGDSSQLAQIITRYLEITE
jgi:cell filamentation protein